MATEELRRQTFVSGGVAWLTRVVQAGLSLGAAVVLARLLTPDAFGVFAMVVPVGVVANQLAGQAFQVALLQRQELAPEETNSLFWFAVRVNLLIAALMVVASLILSAFYREPRVVGMASAWAAVTWFLTLTTFQEALLKRAMRFPAVMLSQFMGLVIGIASAIIAARLGAGHWALAVQLLVMEAVRAVGVAYASRWVPRKAGNVSEGTLALRRAWRALIGYKLASWVGDQPELLAVGRVGGAFTLGLYDTARRWAWYPFEEPYAILSDVAVAGARVAGDDAAKVRFLSRAILVTLSVSLPVIAYVAISAPDLVPVLLGDQWTGAVSFLKLLCVAAFMGALCRVSFWLPLSRSAPEVLLRWSALVQAPAILLAVIVGVRAGPLGVARGVAISTSLLVVPCFMVMARAGPLRLTGLLSAVWRPVVASIAAAAPVAVWQPGEHPWQRLLISSIVYGAGYLTVWVALPGGVGLAGSLARNLRTAGRSG